MTAKELARAIAVGAHIVDDSDNVRDDLLCRVVNAIASYAEALRASELSRELWALTTELGAYATYMHDDKAPLEREHAIAETKARLEREYEQVRTTGAD